VYYEPSTRPSSCHIAVRVVSTFGSLCHACHDVLAVLIELCTSRCACCDTHIIVVVSSVTEPSVREIGHVGGVKGVGGVEGVGGVMC
jgi:hypothetical protein